MDNHILQKLLEDGTISQEQFDQYSAKTTAEQKTVIKDSAIDQNDQKEDKSKAFNLTEEEFNKRIQSAVDRATNKLGNEKKRLEEQISQLKKEKMSDEERKAFELNEKEEQLKEREAQILEKENRLYTIKALKEAGLDDGSSSSLELSEFVLADTQDKIDTRIKAFKKLLDKMVAAEVDKTFKKNGSKPVSGTSSPAVDNPYSKTSFNFTKQMELEVNNPELAKQLRAQAGL